MPRYLALVVALALGVPSSHGQACQSKPTKRTTAESREAKAAALLDKAKRLLNAGKRKQAIKRLLRLVRRYPKTRAAVQAMIQLTFTPPE